MSMSTLTRMKTSQYSLLSALRYLLGDNADIYLRLWLRRVVMREESDHWVTPGGYTGHWTHPGHPTQCCGNNTLYWLLDMARPDDYAHSSRH